MELISWWHHEKPLSVHSERGFLLNFLTFFPHSWTHQKRPTELPQQARRIILVLLYQHHDANIKQKSGKFAYNGYTAGYGAPECRWNMSISESIKSLTLALKAADLLNQTRSLTRTTTAEYMEDGYSRVMGRYILFSASFNFGKMNAKKNSMVENSMWRGMM